MTAAATIRRLEADARKQVRMKRHVAIWRHRETLAGHRMLAIPLAAASVGVAEAIGRILGGDVPGNDETPPKAH